MGWNLFLKRKQTEDEAEKGTEIQKDMTNRERKEGDNHKEIERAEKEGAVDLNCMQVIYIFFCDPKFIHTKLRRNQREKERLRVEFLGQISAILRCRL